MAEDLAKGNADVNHQHKLFLVSSQPDGQLCYSIVHQARQVEKVTFIAQNECFRLGKHFF